ncbi:MAG: hypothetical protein CM15mP120_21620 [Pseudomonadota bacterium]|nr:MAG: hypothetical protein CM15mP120_21620 [Pseudomonadota bacterium]
MSEERDVLAARKAKMQSWQASVGTYPNEFRRQDLAAELLARHETDDKAALAQARRHRGGWPDHAAPGYGKGASFITLQDVSGQIQCYLAKSNLDDDCMKALPSIGKWGISWVCAAY